ncbi:MAG: helix-turn-helix domain-containing protein [Sphingobacteriales bacterium]
MMEKNNINWYSMSDKALLNLIGLFIRDTRLQQNKTQQQTAEAAGINRSTLIQVEKGNGGTLLTLVQILRVLQQLPVLKNFEVEKKISPLMLAKMEQSKRQRAHNSDKKGEKTDFKSSW